MKFLLLYYYDVDAWAALPEQEREQALRRIQEWQDQPEHAGAMLQTGELAAAEEAMTIHLGPGVQSAAPRVTPGPLAAVPSGRLALGGYGLVEAPSRDEAIALARTWPTAGAYEIWPVVEA